jgi:hypothetical protein
MQPLPKSGSSPLADATAENATTGRTEEASSTPFRTIPVEHREHRSAHHEYREYELSTVPGRGNDLKNLKELPQSCNGSCIEASEMQHILRSGGCELPHMTSRRRPVNI